jgi:16S rRNA (adenine1518-N6/adenine1519-N6)-dimethyltransferase
MVAVAQPSVHDKILEIGPGLGFVTMALLKQSGKVIAVEKDHTLSLYLMKHFAKANNLTVIQGDALKLGKLDCNKIVSSPPYYLSSKLILFIISNQFDIAVLLLQNEFVQRLIANNGSPEYGRLTVVLRCKAEAKMIMKVPRTAFYPKPNVDSAIVTIEPREDPFAIENTSVFEELIRFLFTQRRRKLKTVLTRYLRNRYPRTANSILTQTSFLEKRIFQISPAELVDLSNQIVYKQQEIGETPVS